MFEKHNSNDKPHTTKLQPLSFVLVLLTVLGLTACGGGAGTESNPQVTTTSTEYSGPPPATADVQAFRLSVWDNLKSAQRCGACHGTGGQTPSFVRQDNINQAYSEASQIVNLRAPEESRMVTKVAGGHNCWDELEVCREVLIAYISNWAGGAAAGARQIELKAPVIKDAGASKNFPADAGLFQQYVHPLLTAHCAGCHTEAAATPQAPYFANSDADAAHDAAKSKIDLDTPANSRLVVRLRNEFHNCWDNGDCANNATTMQTAIENMAAGIATTAIDPQLVLSKALNLSDGIVASGGNRHEANLIALYEFKHLGADNIAYDTSGVEPALNLTLSGNVNWVGGYGIEIVDGKAQGSTRNSKKLHDLIKASGEYSIEAWVVPANVTQEGPARIISYSAGTTARNFTLGQTLYNYDFLQRSGSTDANGEPALSTDDNAEVLQATQQHVVATYDPVNGRRLYVNGEFTGDLDSVAGGNLNDWDDSFAFILGNEASSDRLWQGKLRMVAIHNRALSTAQIKQNFEVGVGEKLYLLFSVSHLIDVPDSYILLEASQFDSYSYLFYKPTFISLDANARPNGIPIQGLRIGINGKQAKVGQAYVNLNTSLNAADYTPAGQVLSNLGTTIALEKGIDSDEFFITFDVLGNHRNVQIEAAPLQPAPPPDPAPVSDIGLRTFDEINASMAEVTGVDPQTSNVLNTYNTIKQQLPTVESIDGFLSAHQVAITQLAFEYCSTLVEDSSLRATFFGGFNFGADVATAFATADSIQKNQIIDNLTTALYNTMIGANLTTAPTFAEVRGELGNETDNDSDGIGDGLFEKLTASCPTGCDAARTRTTVKGMCAAVLGSAGMLIQ